MTNEQSINAMNDRFALPGLHFETTPGGLVRATIETDKAVGEVYLQGAHVTGFTPAGHEPVLFLSRDALLKPGQAIRGGVPVCFPWFGAHPTDKSAPMHGPVRKTPWQVQDTSSQDGRITIALSTAFDPLAITHRISFGDELSMTLQVHNTSTKSTDFEAALHTYFHVADIRHTQVAGLERAQYMDKVENFATKTQDDMPIHFIGETDRLYVNTETACVLTDPDLSRRITVNKSGSRSTVVWNPWIEKAAALKDMADDEWTRMLCIETANAGPNRVTLKPGAQHDMTAVIAVNHL